MVGKTAENGKKKFVEESENNQYPKKAKKADKYLTDISQCLSDTCNHYYI